MNISTLRTKGIMLLLTVPLLLGGCAYGPVKPTDVSEYRYFPDYGGYLPITDDTVRADWVLPAGKTPDDGPDYAPPDSLEMAKTRVNETAERGKVIHPKVSGSIAYLLYYPASVLMVAVVIPGLLVSPLLPTEKWSPEATERKKQEEKQKQIVELAGISVRLQVMDGDGKAIPEPRVIEVPSPMDIPTYSDEKGLRSFAPVSYNLYELSPSILELLTHDLQTYPGNRDNLADWIGDQDGIISNTSLAAARFLSYVDDERWQWVRTPYPLKLCYIVWAPGYKPSLYTFQNANHGDTLDAKIMLDKEENAKRPQIDSSTNIWRLKEEYDNFVINFLPWPYGYKRTEEVELAKNILARGLVVDPDFPGLDSLRTVIALADGDNDRAVYLSHYINHYAYFRLFYGLKLAAPQY